MVCKKVGWLVLALAISGCKTSAGPSSVKSALDHSAPNPADLWACLNPSLVTFFTGKAKIERDIKDFLGNSCPTPDDPIKHICLPSALASQVQEINAATLATFNSMGCTVTFVPPASNACRCSCNVWGGASGGFCKNPEFLQKF